MTTSRSKKPLTGDLVRWTLHGDVGIIEECRGLDVKVRWLVPIRDDADNPHRTDGRLIDFSWLRRGYLEIISRS